MMIVHRSWYIILDRRFYISYWLSFFRFFLLCYQFIPVSLYVTMSCIYASAVLGSRTEPLKSLVMLFGSSQFTTA